MPIWTVTLMPVNVKGEALECVGEAMGDGRIWPLGATDMLHWIEKGLIGASELCRS